MIKAMRALGVLAGVALLAVAAFMLYPSNLARRPPELDALHAALLKQTRIEAVVNVDTFLDHPNLEGNVKVTFPHVPPQVDKVEIEKIARALVKEHLPLSKELDIRFGDNLRTKPLAIDKPKNAFQRVTGEAQPSP